MSSHDHSQHQPTGGSDKPPAIQPAAPDGRAGMDHTAMDHGAMQPGMRLAERPTPTQLVAVNFLSVLVLAAGLIYSALFTNLNLSARDVGGAIMPPGMIMTYDTPGQSMVDMAAVDPRDVSYTAPVDTQGDQPLEPRRENGVKVFDLDVSVIQWNILPYEQVMAYAFNRQVPGPRLRVTEGDRVRINVTNNLPEETSVHWHGLILPNAMDGPAEITQPPIEPGRRALSSIIRTESRTGSRRWACTAR